MAPGGEGARPCPRSWGDARGSAESAKAGVEGRKGPSVVRRGGVPRARSGGQRKARRVAAARSDRTRRLTRAHPPTAQKPVHARSRVHTCARARPRPGAAATSNSLLAGSAPA